VPACSTPRPTIGVGSGFGVGIGIGFGGELVEVQPRLTPLVGRSTVTGIRGVVAVAVEGQGLVPGPLVSVSVGVGRRGRVRWSV
jgi:hypothetical protein